MKYTKDRETAKALHDELVERKKNIQLEKNDTIAIIIAALTTLLPMLIVVLSIFVLITYIIFF